MHESYWNHPSLFPGCNFFLLPKLMLRGVLITAGSQSPCIIIEALSFIMGCLPLPAWFIQWCHSPLFVQIPITFIMVMNCDRISTGSCPHWQSWRLKGKRGKRGQTYMDKEMGIQKQNIFLVMLEEENILGLSGFARWEAYWICSYSLCILPALQEA